MSKSRTENKKAKKNNKNASRKNGARKEKALNLEKVFGFVLKSLIYIYLLLPFFIFAVGWLKWYFALPIAVGILYALFRAIREDTVHYGMVIGKLGWIKLIVALGMILVWVRLSGLGGVYYQNYDHKYRSGIFRALVEYNWPVVSLDGSRTLIYYIGFWLPSAVVGKLFGYATGYSFQMTWAVLGIFLVYAMLCVWRKKVSLWPLLVVIFFSGLDLVGWWIQFPDWGGYPEMEHLEVWPMGFQFSCMTTQLFWVFNQAVPAWVACMFFMLHGEEGNRRNLLLVLGSLMLSATFPFVGLLPFAVYFLLKDFRFTKECLKERIREIFTAQNMIGVFVIGVVTFLYLLGNVSAGSIARDSAASAGNGSGNLLAAAVRAVSGTTVAYIDIFSLEGIWIYLWFYLLEFGVFAILISKYEYKNPLYYIIIGSLILCPMIKVGGAHDFCMRASIPALFMLMLLMIRDMEKMARAKSVKQYVCLGLCLASLALGAATANNEIQRTLFETYVREIQGKRVTQPEVSAEYVLTRGNFSGPADSFFMKYLAK